MIEDGPKTFVGPASFLNRVLANILNLGVSKATIASGAINVVASVMTVDTEAAAASDDLDNINGGMVGDVVILFGEDPTNHAVVVKHNAPGNIRLNGAADLTINLDRENIVLIRIVQPATGSDLWHELSRSS